MKYYFIHLLLVFFAFNFSVAQNTDKKTHSFEVKRVINAPADKVWEIVGEQYADIANSHPGVVKSEYIGESTAPGEGCERVCFFNLGDDWW